MGVKLSTVQVSVIIPTFQRPALVTRAVQSALAQTVRDIEIIVVMDGIDENTRRVLGATTDSRLRVLELESNQGTPYARNVGVEAARAPWIALLDDDDEWMAEKLERQLETAKKSRFKYPVITCRVIARHDAGDLTWPRRTPRDGESLSEYLFCQSGIRTGEALILPSTVMTLTEFVVRAPFSSGMRRHEDIDWQLRASRVDGFGIEFVPTTEPLVIWHVESNRHRMSLSTDWRHSLEWARKNRALFTPRAYASFMMTNVSNTAAQHGDGKGLMTLLWEAHRRGRPGFFDWLACLTTWLMPMQKRRQLTIWLQRHTGFK